MNSFRKLDRKRKVGLGCAALFICFACYGVSAVISPPRPNANTLAPQALATATSRPANPTIDIRPTATYFAEQVAQTQTVEARPPTDSSASVSATPSLTVTPTDAPTDVPTDVPTRVPPTLVIIAAPTDACDPNYTPCVPAGVADVDCEGGDGDGPVYVKGPITIIGSDHYRLNNDDDNIACDK